MPMTGGIAMALITLSSAEYAAVPTRSRNTNPVFATATSERMLMTFSLQMANLQGLTVMVSGGRSGPVRSTMLLGSLGSWVRPSN